MSVHLTTPHTLAEAFYDALGESLRTAAPEEERLILPALLGHEESVRRWLGEEGSGRFSPLLLGPEDGHLYRFVAEAEDPATVR